MLHQIAYVSLAQEPLDPDLLSEILDVSRKNNQRDGVTGVLMYHEGLYFQILEGEKSSVERCYDRIARDPRHSNQSIILDCDIEGLSFPDWLMGYAGPDVIRGHAKETFKSLSDMNDEAGTTTYQGSVALDLAYLIFKKN